jgi:hypothetical protein
MSKQQLIVNAIISFISAFTTIYVLMQIAKCIGELIGLTNSQFYIDITNFYNIVIIFSGAFVITFLWLLLVNSGTSGYDDGNDD